MISFKHNFPKAGKEWTADVNFNKSRNENNNLLTTNNYTAPGGTLTRSFQQLLNGGGRNTVPDNTDGFCEPDYRKL